MPGLERSTLIELFLRVADALERSAGLAEQHAERDRSEGRSGRIELEAATRARDAAARARTLANRL